MNDNSLSFNEILKHISGEIAKADIEMQTRQNQAWDGIRELLKEDAKPITDEDITVGLPTPSQYLEIKEVEMNFRLEAYKKGFWQRLTQCWNYLRDKSSYFDIDQFRLMPSGTSNNGGINIRVTFQRKKKGEFKAKTEKHPDFSKN